MNRTIKKQTQSVTMMALAAAWGLTAYGQSNFKHLEGKAPFLTLTSEQIKESKVKVHPFLNSSLPKPGQYNGGFFQLNHQYPMQVEPAPQHFPWQQVTKGSPITTKNALDYVQALKTYVSKDMRGILFDRNNPNNPDWYQSIWLGTERDPIHGVYVGSGFPAGTLTDQTLDLTTYVYTLYDKRAAANLGAIWGTDLNGAMNPSITPKTTQFSEGSIIVKFAFVTSCGADWSPMEGAATWQIYAPINASNGSATFPESKCAENGSDGSSQDPSITNIYLMQFDIIVKDSIAAPETGWVFSTLVYDKNATGKDPWDKMVPLGATWGGDPDIINTQASALTPPVKVNAQLKQNWINMQTPLYARSTLGWDGRLSGPNDGAVVTPAWAGDSYYHKGLASAGCLACHSSAQYPMTSFLLPTTTIPTQTIAPPLSSNSSAASLVLNEPGDNQWMNWFQSRDGKTPMGPVDSHGQMPVALDYDMVTAFKAIPMWKAALKALAD